MTSWLIKQKEHLWASEVVLMSEEDIGLSEVLCVHWKYLDA